MPAAEPSHVVLPPGTRRAALVVVMVGALVLGVLGLRFRGESHERWLDAQIQDAVDGALSGRSPLVGAVLGLGGTVSVVVAAFLLASAAVLLGRRRLAVLAVLGPGLTGVTTTALKPLVGRTIDGELAYPSGHAGGATALAVAFALLLTGVLRTGRRVSVTLIVGAPLLVGTVMGLALTARQWHYPTDAIGGSAAAFAVMFGGALVAERFAVDGRRRDAALTG